MRESRCTAWIFQVFARWSWVPPRTPMVLRSFYQTLDFETILVFLSCSFSVEPIFFGIHKWYSLRTRLNRSNHWFRGGPWKFKPRGQRFATAGRVATTSRWAAGTMAQFRIQTSSEKLKNWRRGVWNEGMKWKSLQPWDAPRIVFWVPMAPAPSFVWPATRCRKL